MNTDGRPTEQVMLGRLRRRYGAVHGNGARWVFAAYVRDAAGFDARRTADAVAMDLWPSKGLELHGHEIKISRTDWLREVAEPEKAAAVSRYMDRWWLVVPDPAIVRDGELPDRWGLIICTADGCRVARPAPKLVPEPVRRSFLAALLRAAVRNAATSTSEGATTVTNPDVNESCQRIADAFRAWEAAAHSEWAVGADRDTELVAFVLHALGERTNGHDDLLDAVWAQRYRAGVRPGYTVTAAAALDQSGRRS